jgi:hypothetical protein
VPPDSRASRRARQVAAAISARRMVRSAGLWGAVFGGYIAYAAWEYATSYPTVASREKIALTFGTNAGFSALLGQGQRLATIAGFTAWRAMGVLVPVGAVWAMLAATRLTRGEEDAGRLELLLAGQTTRRRAVAQAEAGLAAGLAVLWGDHGSSHSRSGIAGQNRHLRGKRAAPGHRRGDGRGHVRWRGSARRPAGRNPPPGQRHRCRDLRRLAADPCRGRLHPQPALAALAEPAWLGRESPPAYQPGAGDVPAHRGIHRSPGSRGHSRGRTPGHGGWRAPGP